MNGMSLLRRTARAIAAACAALLFAGCTAASVSSGSIWTDGPVPSLPTAPPPPSGASWKTVGPAGFIPMGVAYISIAINQATGVPYIAFSDTGSGTSSAMSFNGGWGFIGAQFFSSPQQAVFTRMAVDPSGIAYVAYQDLATGGINVCEYLSPSWMHLGVTNFDVGQPSTGVALALDASGTPYVAYLDSTGRAKVQKWTGVTGWQPVGSQSLFNSSASNVSLAIDSSGNPWVAYEDGPTGNKATVMRFDGASWSIVGSAAGSASTGSVANTSLALDSFDVPYLACWDNGTGGRATVKTFQAGAWINVGSPGFSANNPYDITIAVRGGVPYVLYRDGSPGGATLMTYGTSWQPVGSPGFTPVNVQFISLALDPLGTPYVAFADASSFEPYVMAYH